MYTVSCHGNNPQQDHSNARFIEVQIVYVCGQLATCL